MAAALNDDMPGMRKRSHNSLACKRVRLLRGAPEGMAFWQCQWSKGQHGPVRRPGRVIVFCQIGVWIRITDAEHTVGLKDVLLGRPPSKISEPDAPNSSP